MTSNNGLFTDAGFTAFRAFLALEPAIVNFRVERACVRVKVLQHDAIEASELVLVRIVVAVPALAHVRAAYKTLARLVCALFD
jgi:hypothetical protein